MTVLADDFDWGSVAPGSTVILHPRRYGEILGLRRTRGGFWSWRGRRWRTRALATRRLPAEAWCGHLVLRMDPHGVVEPGRALVAPPICFTADCFGLMGPAWTG